MFDFNMLNKYAQLCLRRNVYLNALQANYKIYSDYNSLKAKLKKDLIIKIPIRILILVALAFIVYYSYFWGVPVRIGEKALSLEIRIILVAVLYFSAIIFAVLFVFTLIKVISTIIKIIKLIRLKIKLPAALENIKQNEELNNQISKEIAAYNLLPVCYWHLGNVIVQYILNGRADTIKDAINLYELEFRQDMQFRAQMDALNRIYNQLVNNKMVNAAGMAMISSSIIFK